MAQIKTLMNVHAKRYISMVFEKTLQEEGFTCLDDKSLCWYRVRNNEILDTVIFCTSDSRMPMMLDVQFEVSPLYFAPISTTSVKYTSNAHVRWDCVKRIPIYELVCGERSAISLFNNDIQVYAPTEGNRGLYILNEVVLPYFRMHSTPHDCYQSHKNVHLNIDPRYKSQIFSNMSLDFMQEAIYNDDAMVYPYCKDRALKAINMYNNLTEKKPHNQELVSALREWKLLQDVVVDKRRNEYIEILEQRKVRNIEFLKRKLHIVF